MMSRMVGNARKKTVIVVGAMALAAIAFHWLHLDFIGGLAFGTGLGVLLCVPAGHPEEE